MICQATVRDLRRNINRNNRGFLEHRNDSKKTEQHNKNIWTLKTANQNPTKALDKLNKMKLCLKENNNNQFFKTI